MKSRWRKSRSPNLVQPRDFYSDAEVGLCTFDLEMRFQHVNSWLAAVHGASVEDHLGQRIEDINIDIAFDLSPRLRVTLDTGEVTSAVTGVMDGTLDAGQVRNFQYSCSPLHLKSGKIEGVSCVVHEYTEQSQLRFDQQKIDFGLRNIIGGIPAGIAHFDTEERYRFANSYYRSLIPKDTAGLVGMRLAEVLGAQAYSIAGKYVERVLRGESVNFENELTFPDGSLRHIKASYVPDLGLDGSVTGFFAMVQDISEFKQAEIELQKANEALTDRVNQRTAELEHFGRALENEVEERKNAIDQFISFLEATPDPTVVVNAEGKIDLANSRIESVLGYTPQELQGTSVEVLIPKASQTAHISHRRGYSADPIPRMMGSGKELVAVKKNGEELPVEVSLTPARIAGRDMTIAHIRDVSAEREVRDHVMSLSARLLSAQENERSRIARELHDDFSQRLALLVINLGRLEDNKASGSAKQRKELKDIVLDLQENANEIAADINRLSHQLHPPVLDHIGLAAAIGNLCEELSSLHDVNLGVEQSGETTDISKDAALCLYRIAQEALWNVVRHSAASDAIVSLEFGPTETRLRVGDNGIGFDPSAAASGEGLGLISMRERLLLVNGNLAVRQLEPSGTEVTATVPT